MRAPAGGFHGDYASWEAAAARATGYDDAAIVRRVLEATLAVRRGDAAFERDSVLFDRSAPRYAVLAELLASAAAHQGELRVLDFGGALGSLYFQHRSYFSALRRVEWNVVEQESFVAAGREHLEQDGLRFFTSIEDSLAHATPAIVMASCVLQYLPQPREMLLRLAAAAPRMVLDRLPLIDAPADRLTLQTVPASIYPASYPAWFLARRALADLLEANGYVVESEFESIDVMELDGRTFPSAGWIIGRGANA